MAKKNENIVVDGTVNKVLPNASFEVTLEGKHLVIAHVSGKMRMHYVKLIPGDKVAVELTPYDLKRGRIILRYKN
jgi:translation initiation factor IF-1